MTIAKKRQLKFCLWTHHEQLHKLATATDTTCRMSIFRKCARRTLCAVRNSPKTHCASWLTRQSPIFPPPAPARCSSPGRPRSFGRPAPLGSSARQLSRAGCVVQLGGVGGSSQLGPFTFPLKSWGTPKTTGGVPLLSAFAGDLRQRFKQPIFWERALRRTDGIPGDPSTGFQQMDSFRMLHT